LFIEVSEGISVNVECIQEVESTPTGSVVHTARGSYPSAFPYRLLLSLIAHEEKEEPKAPQEIKFDTKSQNALNSLGHYFAG
jgi:hypothetical protein